MANIKSFERKLIPRRGRRAKAFPKAKGMESFLLAIEELRFRGNRAGTGQYSVARLHAETGWYLNVRVGKTPRITPQQVLRIAGLLGCKEGDEETNRLLLAAGFQPHVPFRSEAELKRELTPLRAMMNRMEHESFILLRDFSIVDANQACLDLWGINRNMFDKEKGLERMHLLKQAYNLGGDAPVYRRLNPHDHPAYVEFLKVLTRSFMIANAMATTEPFYIELREALKQDKTAGAFYAQVWDQVNIATKVDEGDIADRVFCYWDAAGQPVPVKCYRLTVVDVEFPQIAFYLRLEEEGRERFG